MASIPQGILGAFIGKAGPVTGYMRNGRNIIRTSRSQVVYKITTARQAQLTKVQLCNAFTRAFSGTGFFNTCFPANGQKGTGYNRATSLLLHQAIDGIYPHLQVCYPLVSISKGHLPPPAQARASINAQGIIHFQFASNIHTGTAAPSDQAILVAFAPGLQQAVFTLQGGQRMSGEAFLDASAFMGETVETWVGFLSENMLQASDSVYTGKLVLIA